MPVESPKLTLFQGRVHIGYRGDGKRDPVKGGGCVRTADTIGLCLLLSDCGDRFSRVEEFVDRRASGTRQGIRRPDSLPGCLSGSHSRPYFPSKKIRKLATHPIAPL